MKAIITKKVRFIDNNDDFVEILSITRFFGIPIYGTSKKVVVPVIDSEMYKTKMLYKNRVTTNLFSDR